MRKPKNEHKKISLQVTLAQENQLKRMAALENKSISAYVRDIVFSSTLDTAKIDFYKNINDDLIFLKRYQYAMSKLLLLIGKEQLLLRTKNPEDSKQKAQELIMNFFNSCMSEAEKKF